MVELYKINPDIAWREIDGQILILDSQQNQMAHDLNEMGTFIFCSLATGKGPSSIKEELIKNYSHTPKEKIESDFDSFIEKLINLKLIQK